MSEGWRNCKDADKPIYPVDEREQYRALQESEQLADFRRIRKELSADPYRPRYHFLRPDTRMNDPNGLCYWHGKWHLFYQAIDSTMDNIHWGHAVSTDLIRWSDLPYAIFPGVESCWSGTCYVEKNRVLAAYYGYTNNSDHGIVIAQSSDPFLLNWEKLNGGNAVISQTPETLKDDAPYRVFDPCLWKEDDTYFLITGAYETINQASRCIRQMYLFCSRDLINWTFITPFLRNDHFTQAGDDGACPYFLPFGKKHILFHYSHLGVPKYLVGSYDIQNRTFQPHHGDQFAQGYFVLTAPSVAPLGDDLVAIFNMKEARNNGRWREIMTLPRRIRSISHDRIAISPAGDIDSLHGACVSLANMCLPSEQEIVIPEVCGDCVEIQLTIAAPTPPVVEINILRSPDKQEYTRITFLKKRGSCGGRVSLQEPNYSLLVLDSTQSSMDPISDVRSAETAMFIFNDDDELSLRIFIDKSVVEAFVNDKQCVSQRVYPARDDSRGFSIKARKQDGKLSRIACWQMESIYPAE